MQKKILSGLLTVTMIFQMFTGVSYATEASVERDYTVNMTTESESMESELIEPVSESAESKPSESMSESAESKPSESVSESVESKPSESVSESAESELSEAVSESMESELSEAVSETMESELSESETESLSDETSETETDNESETPETSEEIAYGLTREPMAIGEPPLREGNVESSLSLAEVGSSEVAMPSYHTAAEIEDYLAGCGATLNDQVTYEINPTTSGQYNLGALSGDTLNSAVSMLNQIRYIAGLDSVSLNSEYSRLSQAGALVNYANGKLDHYPDKPSQMSDELYQLGKQGCSSSNLAYHSNKNATLNYAILRMWMEDSDSSNIDRVGHRRWFLNPAMKSVGFGAVKGEKGIFSAAYVFDSVYTDTSVTGVAWPARVMPTSYFSAGDAWSVSIGTYVEKASVKVSLTRQKDGKVWNFSSKSADGYFNVDNGGYGQVGCIIFRPGGISSYNDGDVFDVHISYGSEQKLDYTVSFFSVGKTYSITYELNGGINNSNNPAKYSASSDTIVLYPATKDEYEFMGWYKDKNYTQPVTSIPKGSVGDLTIYARWKFISSIRVEDVPDQIYTGQAVTVDNIKVYNGDDVLVSGEDYVVSYRNNIQVADKTSQKAPSLIITAKGNYQGIIVKTFSILPVSMNSSDISVQKMAVAYRKGTIQKPIPVVTWNGIKLSNNRDYIAKYEDNPSEAGVYRLTVTGRGNFTGDVQTTLSIVNNTDVIAMSSVKIAKKIPNQEYTSDGVRIHENMITLKYGNTELIPGTDYTFQTCVYRNSGMNYVTIQGNGKYAGELKATFRINGTAASSLKLSSLEYTGDVLRPVIRDSKGNTLKEGEDYVVHSLTGTEVVGTAKVSITGKGAYYGTTSKSFKITAHSIAANDVQAKLSNPDAKQPYEKNGARPKVIVSYKGRMLREGTDYTLSYKNNKVIGDTATVVVKGKKNFSGSREITFTVGKSSLGQVSVYVPDKVVSTRAGGYVSKPVLTDTNGVKLSEGRDYEKNMTYTSDGKQLNNKVDKIAAGKEVTVTITGKGDYEGTATATYRILPAGKDISKASVKLNRKIYFNGTKVTLSKSDITVKIGKVTVPPESYEIVSDSYVNNNRKGTAKVTIRGIGEYGGTKTISFRIHAQRMN